MEKLTTAGAGKDRTGYLLLIILLLLVDAQCSSQGSKCSKAQIDRHSPHVPHKNKKLITF